MSQQGQTRLREIPANQEAWSPSHSAPSADNSAAQASISLLLLALKTLSQRTIVALAALRGLLLASSVFALAFRIVDDPSSLKLTGLGIYATFVLIAEFMVGRRHQ